MKPPSVDLRGARREFSKALGKCRSAFIGVAIFSGVINVLMLTGPLFMLQIYDRVLPSRSVPTLIGFALLAAAMFAFQGILDAVRGRVLWRVGATIDEQLSTRVHDAVMRLPMTALGKGDGLQPTRDLDHIRGFLGSAGPGALFDLPWMPLYVFVCYLFHPLIGLLALFGAVLLTIVTLTTEAMTRGPVQQSAVLSASRNRLLEACRRNAESIAAMGMTQRLLKRFDEMNATALEQHRLASDRSGGLGALTRILRMVLQSGVLALGAYLVIQGEASPGVIIASSILVARALAPVELAIANWKGFVQARQGRRRLIDLFAALPEQDSPMALPRPEAWLSVEKMSVAPPGLKQPVVLDMNFRLERGSALGVIGPSASGKSSLARALVGIWNPLHGMVRLDGAALDQWSQDGLGAHIGYLPQGVELLEGTVAENISRFEQDADPEAIIAAAKAAHVHELILGLPEGYETQIGEAGAALSAGQRQRIALARAMYRDPFLVVLDEPNSNLDAEGEQALTDAIMSIRGRGGIAVVIAHRPSALAAVDQVLAMAKGASIGFGPRDDVLRNVLRPAPVVPASQPAADPSAVRRTLKARLGAVEGEV